LSPCYAPAVRVAKASEFSLTVERSRFHALLAPLAAANDTDALLKTRRRDYRKANHHSWACRVRDAAGAVIELSKDDGEVGHPGRVLLELLRKYDLEGALVVSRIFGGVKLGVGGVSRAFRDAGQGAINGVLRAAPVRTSSPDPQPRRS
jgi:putative IMPACT (imprinted ancient) family translation regulator